MAQRVTATSIVDAIAIDLRTRLFAGELTPDVPLTETEIAMSYDVARPTAKAAIEKLVAGSAETGKFCHGNTPTMADICLIPQMANARRVEMDLSVYPTLLRIEKEAFALPAFDDALPKNQPDAE